MEINEIAKILTRQIEREEFNKKYATAEMVLKLVGAGLFLAASFAAPNLPKMLAPFFKSGEREAWKRFDVPYLRRTLNRLEKQKLIEIEENKEGQVVKITENGKMKILKMALNGLVLDKPRIWDGNWWIVIYDIPKLLKDKGDIFREYLRAWRFYPLQESIMLHAYPCRKQVEFLRDYLRISKYVRILKATEIENDGLFRDFFGV